MSMFKFQTIKVFIFSWILLLILSLLSSKVESLKLDIDGGYSILVGIDSFAAESEPDLENLIQSIKDALNDLSSRMYYATQRFYIKNADILLRSHSQFVETDGDAVSEDYRAADFQISGKVLKPEVVNPNGCGLPGDRLSFPVESFNNSDSIISGKSLLHLFARYRWGVFEEDGSSNYFGRYPHFYRTTRNESSWVHTSCSDTPLVGSVEPSQGEEYCDITNLEEYPHTCEFVPSPSEAQTASSSLMNYYWLDSIHEFCDILTHNVLSPNAQNILCHYRSVMEVIRGTQDWGVVSEPPQTAPPAIIFKVLGLSQSPRLYLLLDRGTSFAPATVITAVKNKIGNMLQLTNSSIVMGIGAYPASTTDSMMDSLVTWSLVESIKSNITDIMDENFASGIHDHGNFANALLQLSKNIQASEHPFGTVIVILKTGPPDSFANAPHEYDVIATLNGLPVKVYALEIVGNDVMPGLNLENLAMKTGGLHTVIDDAASVVQKLDVFVKNIVEELQNLNIPEKTLAHVYKGYHQYSGTPFEHELGATMSTLQVSVTSSSSLNSVTISVNGVDLSTEKSLEWTATSVEGKREVYYASTTSNLTGTVSVSFECESDIPCAAFLVITGDSESPNEEALTSIEITTSSVNDVVDWSQTDLIQPFRIYAKVTMPDDSTIESMTGIVCSVNGDANDCQNIPLVDDGFGDPDVLRNDDIYSCAFIPLKDDSYYIRIVSKSVKVENGENLHEIRSFDHNAIIKFKGVSNFKPTVGRIIDLSVVERSNESITLELTSPVTYALGAVGNPAETYELRYTPQDDYVQFIKDFENYPEVPPTSLPKPAVPGEIQTITIDLTDSNEKFFAIRASYKFNKGEISNIVSSAFSSVKTTNPPSTSTTTEDPFTTTEEPTTTTEDLTTTTEDPTTITEDSNTTTEDPTTTTGESTTTTEDSSTTDPTTSTEFSSSESSATASIPQSSTPVFIRSSTTSPSTTPKTELFFKKPIGYITAAAGGVTVVALVGGSVAYLCWKRKQLIDSGRLKLV